MGESGSNSVESFPATPKRASAAAVVHSFVFEASTRRVRGFHEKSVCPEFASPTRAPEYGPATRIWRFKADDRLAHAPAGNTNAAARASSNTRRRIHSRVYPC